jgi:hypothetical protein
MDKEELKNIKKQLSETSNDPNLIIGYEHYLTIDHCSIFNKTFIFKIGSDDQPCGPEDIKRFQERLIEISNNDEIDLSQSFGFPVTLKRMK